MKKWNFKELAQDIGTMAGVFLVAVVMWSAIGFADVYYDYYDYFLTEEAVIDEDNFVCSNIYTINYDKSKQQIYLTRKSVTSAGIMYITQGRKTLLGTKDINQKSINLSVTTGNISGWYTFDTDGSGKYVYVISGEDVKGTGKYSGVVLTLSEGRFRDSEITD